MASSWAAVVAKDFPWIVFVSARSANIIRSSGEGLVAVNVGCRKAMVSEMTMA